MMLDRAMIAALVPHAGAMCLIDDVQSYDDSRIIAKQQEEALLYQDMERDAVAQIMRRMAAIKRPA